VWALLAPSAISSSADRALLARPWRLAVLQIIMSYSGRRSSVRPLLLYSCATITLLPDCSRMGNILKYQTSCSTVQYAEQTRHPIHILFTCTLPPHAPSPLRHAVCGVWYASAHAPFSAWPNSLAPIVSSFQGHESQEGGALFHSYLRYAT
jgi:hypothetical protein